MEKKPQKHLEANLLPADAWRRQLSPNLKHPRGLYPMTKMSTESSQHQTLQGPGQWFLLPIRFLRTLILLYYLIVVNPYWIHHLLHEDCPLKSMRVAQRLSSPGCQAQWPMTFEFTPLTFPKRGPQSTINKQTLNLYYHHVKGCEEGPIPFDFTKNPSKRPKQYIRPTQKNDPTNIQKHI